MNLFTLSLAYLHARKLTNILLVVLLALGVATMSLLFHCSHQAEARLSRDAQGIDLVVGAKGSPLQLVLSSVYHMDIPTGNIARKDADTIIKNPQVKQAIPLALGDSYHGFRIVGTDANYAQHYNAQLADGMFFSAPMEAVAGADTGLSVGSSFAGNHGLVESNDVHAEFPYKVVGVLKPTSTVLDRLILTPLESVWRIHEGHHHHDEDEKEEHASNEITALLVSYKSPISAMSMPREINRNTNMQAASPALEIARLLSLLGIGIDTLHMFGAVLMASAVVGMLVALYQSMQARRYDLAIMRVLGGTKATLIKQVLLESLILLAAGIALGLLLSHGALGLLPHLSAQLATLKLNAFAFLPEELMACSGLLLAGLLVSVLPAFSIYRMDVSRILAHG